MSREADPAFGLLIEAFANGDPSSAAASFAREARSILDFVGGRLGAAAPDAASEANRGEIARGELQWWMLWLAWGQSAARATELLSALGDESELAEDVAFLRAILSLVRDELAVIPDSLRSTPAGLLLAEAAAVRSHAGAEQKTLLETRIERATDREFRTLLRIDLAVLCHEDGDASEACECLMAAIHERSSETWLALALLEHVLRKGRLQGLMAREGDAARLRAEVLAEATGEVAQRALGVRRWQVEPARMAEAWMFAARAVRGDAEFTQRAYEAAAQCLHGAQNSIGARAIAWSARAHFEVAGDRLRAAKWGEKLPREGTLGEVVASRDLLLSHLHEGPSQPWLDAALADPNASTMARAVHFVRTTREKTPIAHGRAWRLQSEVARIESVKHVAALASAWFFALAGESAEARTSLSIALTNGVSPLRVARLAPVLARMARDEDWLDAARDIQRDVDPGVDPCVNALMGYVRAHDAGGRMRALLRMGGGDSAAMARLLAGLGDSCDARSWRESLREAARDLSDSSELRFGLDLLLAFACARKGEDVTALTVLAEGQPSIEWLQWAAIAAVRGDAKAAAEIAIRASEQCDREQLAFALTAVAFRTKHGISHQTLEALRRASVHPVAALGAEIAETWLGQVLDAQFVARLHPALGALDRFAAGHVSRAPDAREVAISLEETYGGDADLVLAAALGEALFCTDKERAIEVLTNSTEGPVQDIGMWLRTMKSTGAGLATADHAEWFHRAPSLGAARSWLAAAMVSKDDFVEPWSAVISQAPAALRPELQAWIIGGGQETIDQSLDDAIAQAGKLPVTLAAKQLAVLGWPLLAEGRVRQAVAAFERATATLPREASGWLGLKCAARLSGDKALVARACARLGQLTTDAEAAAIHFEEAGVAFDSLGEAVLSEACLTSAFAKSPRRGIAFERLFRSARRRKDADAVIDLTSRRLDVADDPRELVKIYWERARAFRQNGDLSRASEALQNVNVLDDCHLGALALSSEIAIKEDRHLDAAIALERLATQEGAPFGNRLSAAIAAIDIFENKVAEPKMALSMLARMESASELPVMLAERQVRIAIALSDYPTATRGLEVLMRGRKTPDERVEAARLALALYRDKLQDHESALRTIRHLLGDAPTDGEAIDQLLSRTDVELEAWRPLLVHVLDELRERFRVEGADYVRALRLARLAQLLGANTLEAMGWSLALAVSSVRARNAQDRWKVVAPAAESLREIRLSSDELARLRGEVDPCPFGEAYGAVLDFLFLREASSEVAVEPWQARILQAFDARAEKLDVRHAAPSEYARLVAANTWKLMPLALCGDDERLIAISVGLCRSLKLEGNFADSPAIREAERHFDKCFNRKERKAIVEHVRPSLPDAVRAWAKQGREALERVTLLFSLDFQKVITDDGALSAPVDDPQVRTLLHDTFAREFVTLAARIWGRG